VNTLLSNRIVNLTESQTLAMAKKSRELAATGIDVINLSLGEPDFDTPEHIKFAAKTAIDDGFTHYPPVAGYLEVRKAICEKLKRENNLNYQPDQILISTGAKQSIANVLLSLINPGDEVIIPMPYWVSYMQMVELAEGTPVMISCKIENQFKLQPAQLEAAITPKTKLIIYSSPCNPTGSVYNQQELRSLADVLVKHPKVMILSDEIYEHINFAGKHYSMAQFHDLHDRVIVVNGVSKGYAMTGWRIGYIAAPKWLTAACEKMQGQFTSAASSIAQKATETALLSGNEPTINMCAAFKSRRDLMLQMLNEIPFLKTTIPDGAFYLFPDVSHYFGMKFNGQEIANASDLCMYLLNQAHVSLVTGDAFGDGNCVRISYATSELALKEAAQRIKKALAALSS
jgi:aspartate aminotransferase